MAAAAGKTRGRAVRAVRAEIGRANARAAARTVRTVAGVPTGTRRRHAFVVELGSFESSLAVFARCASSLNNSYLVALRAKWSHGQLSGDVARNRCSATRGFCRAGVSLESSIGSGDSGSAGFTNTWDVLGVASWVWLATAAPDGSFVAGLWPARSSFWKRSVGR